MSPTTIALATIGAVVAIAATLIVIGACISGNRRPTPTHPSKRDSGDGAAS